MGDLMTFLRGWAEGDLLPWLRQKEAAGLFGLTIGEVEEAALEAGLLPARYQRNRNTISTEQQLVLFRSHVAVIGCGGLGGFIIEQLARLGVGRITAVDPDVFEEHNLNRQLLSSPETLGKPKVDAALARVREINPAVTLIPVNAAFGKDNGLEMLKGVDLAVDALDSITVRLELAEVCAQLNVPMVHGAIGGWYGHVATQFPGETTLNKIYGRSSHAKGVERGLGNPSFTPAVTASLQVSEVCKILTGQGTPLSNRQLHINLFDMEMDEIRY
jgi:molybdopterin/thiamine biosynthesis adenylyltransferase